MTVAESSPEDSIISSTRTPSTDMTDKNIFIEITNMESLNVGVAGGILMYELGGK